MEFYCPKCGYANSNRSDVLCSACGYVWDRSGYEALTRSTTNNNSHKPKNKKSKKKEIKKGAK